MEFSIRQQDQVAIVAPKGKIMGGPDSTVLHEKLRDLIKGNTRIVLIDLAEVDWMNSSGLGILISCFVTLRTFGGELSLANVNAKVQSILDGTRLSSAFKIYDSVDEALKGFQAGS